MTDNFDLLRGKLIAAEGDYHEALLKRITALEALLTESLREHEEDHDPGWACRIEMSGECDCGASKWNAKVNKLLEG